MSRAAWGEPRLFPAVDDVVVERFRVRVAGGSFGPVLSSLAMAVAQARAAALAGGRVEIVAIDGSAVVVDRRDGRFVVSPWGAASWPSRCERLLVEHG